MRWKPGGPKKVFLGSNDRRRKFIRVVEFVPTFKVKVLFKQSNAEKNSPLSLDLKTPMKQNACKTVSVNGPRFGSLWPPMVHKPKVNRIRLVTPPAVVEYQLWGPQMLSELTRLYKFGVVMSLHCLTSQKIVAEL